MEKKYHQYTDWEDFKHGMYKKHCIDKDKKLIDSINLLSNPDNFYNVLSELVKEWPISTSEHLTNVSENRRAWLGAAACCYYCNAPEFITRIAWSMLNNDVQERANTIAEIIIKEYERENTGIHKEMGTKMLF